MRIPLFLTMMSLSATTALAQSAPPLQDDVPLDVYLDALTQISPAARAGANAYLQAFERRCGRPLKAIELRRAIADNSGDHLLMAMMRAASQRDAATLQRLSGTISCARGK